MRHYLNRDCLSCAHQTCPQRATTSNAYAHCDRRIDVGACIPMPLIFNGDYSIMAYVYGQEAERNHCIDVIRQQLLIDNEERPTRRDIERLIEQLTNG